MTKIRVDIKRMMLLPVTLMTLTAAGQNVSGQVWMHMVKAYHI